MNFRLSPLLSAALLAVLAPAAHATNGMNMEGYGPIATGMGGAASATANGTAALMNNPATLMLEADGSRLDLAAGVLGPRVTVNGLDSDGKSYLMPAGAWIRKEGRLAYGVGLFGQGGMGTEFGANTFMAMGSGQPVRSEVGVGRVLFPIAWQANERWSLGATLDYVWMSMDLRMASTGAQLGGLVTGAAGNLAAALPALAGASWARIDFSDNNKFSGAAKTSGWSGKLGALFKANEQLNIGMSHQLKTSLKDMHSSGGSAAMSAQGGFADSGDITVQNFQWPAITTVGAAWQANPALLLAGDVQRIGWADVMKSFNMRYDSAAMGGSVSFSMPQNWRNQTVLHLGGAYKLDSAWTLRGGMNLSSNPIPDGATGTLNPLFPATVRNHYSAGVGYKLNSQSQINASLVSAPKANATTANGMLVTHGQTNYQLMYSHAF